MEIYEMSELKLRKPGEVLREIPDHYYSKRFIPLCDNLFTALRLSDNWGQFAGRRSDIMSFDDNFSKNVRNRLDDAFNTSKEENIVGISKERQKQTVSFWGYPPTLPIRMDMQTLSTTMIYGPSVDISFASLSDDDRDLLFIFNLHVEESIPQEEGLWFLVRSENPDIFNRRHMKLGIRLADLGKKIKDNIEVARRIRDILIDIRNERTPQWSHSAYYIAVFFMAGVANTTMELSNWNSLGEIWDGVNAAERYGLGNCIYNYQPLPPILNMMFQLERPMWIERLANALTGGQLYINHFEKSNLKEMKKQSYDIYDIYMRFYSWQLHQGIVLPSQTLKAIPPVYDNTKNEWIKYGFDFPKGPRIHYEDLGLTYEEMLDGVLLDITNKSKVEKVTRENIISIGHGLETKYLRPEKE
ncbi:MAG: hypothetical protein HWN66_04900 [Candidatus Helarchaeota archaeon]|nr:hypothetical protein [Candidatus Helarchaeota archaeon]